MSRRKATLYSVVFFVLTACSKQSSTPVSESVQAESATSNLQWWPFPSRGSSGSDGSDGGEQTVFGLTQQQSLGETSQGLIYETESQMKEAGDHVTRVQTTLSQNPDNSTIDSYIKDGYNVQVLINWDNGKNGTRVFPKSTDLNLLKSQVTAFFQYYAPYRSQIPFVAFENEWDWQIMHGANLQDLLTELSIVTNIGHQYGFKITDGGITATSIRRWTYSQLTGEEQQEWADTYWIGLAPGYSYFDYNTLMDIINTYIDGVKNINMDYTNVHWYNTSECGNGFGLASETFMEACNKSAVVCNEFFTSTSSLSLFSATVNEIKGYAKYAIAYSGDDDNVLSIRLTDPMLNELH